MSSGHKKSRTSKNLPEVVVEPVAQTLLPPVEEEEKVTKKHGKRDVSSSPEEKPAKKRASKPDETNYDKLLEIATNHPVYEQYITSTIELEDQLETQREECLKTLFALPDIKSTLKNKKQTSKLMTKLNKAIKDSLEVSDNE